MSALGSPKHRKLRTKLLNGKIFVHPFWQAQDIKKPDVKSFQNSTSGSYENSEADDYL